MKRVASPLKFRTTGPAVADLHAALLVLLERGLLIRGDEPARREIAEALGPERLKRSYGTVTRKLVGTLQEERGLAVSGTVDDAAAEAINADLFELGLLDETPRSDETRLIVSGRITSDDGFPVKGAIVRAFHRSDASLIRLGDDTTDAEGVYTIRVPALPDTRALSLRVTVSDQQGDLLMSSDVAGDPGPLVTIDLVVPRRRATNRRWLQGSILDEHGLKAEGMKLRLYRRAFGGAEKLLDEATTGELGRYTFSYDADGNTAGLEVRAVDSAGKEVPLSKVMHDLGGTERATVNLVAPATVQAMAPEYQRLSADLTPFVGDMVKLAGSRENAEHQDLTFLNRSTGWDARLIALAGNAARLSADSDVGLSQESAYALLRAGLPSEKLQLAQVGSDVAERALKTVRTAGIVDFSDQKIGQIKRKFEAFAAKARLAAPIPGSRSTHEEFIKASGIAADAQAKFAKVFIDHVGDGKQLWQEVSKAGVPSGDIGTLQLQGKLAFLTGNSEAMATRLHQGMEIKEPHELVSQGFYKPEKWKAEAKALSGNDEKALDDLIPPAYEGAKVEDRLVAYADDMARKVRRSYPTHVIGHMIEQPDDTFELGAARAPVASVLKNATARGFRFGTTSFDSFAKSKPHVLDGVPAGQVQTVKQGMRNLQRVYQLTPSNEAMAVLMSIGLTSAYDIVAIPRQVFLERHGHRFGSRKEAELVYRKAQQVSSVTYNLFTIAKKLDAEAPVYGMSAPVEVRESVKTELINQFPTMKTLFGSMDFCECEHCHSVLSPAAYLVDLLQFLDPEHQVWDHFLDHWSDRHNGRSYTSTYQKPYDALVARRPDLPHIPLTCENTHTVLPYIDVVNEILEYYVANGRLTEEAAHDTGDAESPDLLAEPQNVVRQAYDLLLKARYPHTLPFDLWLETVRGFCDYFETPLSRVLETFRASDDLFAPTQPYDRESVFIESLGLSPSQYAIFIDPDPLGEERWRELYGYIRVAVDNPTNAGDATIVVADGDARRFNVGEPCTYFDVSAVSVVAETKEIKSIGLEGSGGAERTLITFDGVWGTPPASGDLLVVDVPGVLKSAKALSRRLGVTYKELIEIVRTGFVNPKLDVLTVLYKLDVTVTDVLTYARDRGLLGQDPNALSVEDKKRLEDVKAFEQRLADQSAAFAETGFDAKAWLTTALQNNAFADILVLYDLDTACDFDATTLRYADGRPADPIAFLKIDLFVRLWRALGWSIEETDRALKAFVPKAAPFDAGHLVESPLKTALISISHLKALDERVKVGKQSRQKLMTLWSDIPTTGKKPLYAQLFLTRSALNQDDVFDDPMGRYLSSAGLAVIAQSRMHEVELGNVPPADIIDPSPFAGQPRIKLAYDPLREVQSLAYKGALSDADKAALDALSSSPALSVLLDAVQAKARDFTLIKGHLTAIQGSLSLTADEVDLILRDAGTTIDSAELTLQNVSLLYRYALLAKGLRLSIRELIALKDLSGLDPFKTLHPDPVSTLVQDYPYTQTTRFVEVAEQVKESGLNAADLEYLLRHRFDEVGTYRPDPQATRALMRTLAEGVRTIRAEHVVPDDPGVITEEVLRQKLGLALPSDVVDRFLGMMNGTAEFTATLDSVVAADQLIPDRFSGEASIVEVKYNPARQHQKLTLRGVLFVDQKDDLKARLPRPVSPNPHVPSVVFGTLLDDIQAQALAFFEKHLKKQAPGAQPEGGFLEAADFDLLFHPPNAGSTEAQLQDRLRSQRTALANSFLPFLQQRLIRQFIVQTLTSHTGADPALVETLVTDPRLLVHPSSTNSEPLLDAFAGCGGRGLSAEFFASTDGTGAPLGSLVLFDADINLKDENGVLFRPNGTNSARLEGYAEVVSPGAYRFFVFLDRQGAKAQIRFADAPGPLPAIVAPTDDYSSGGGPGDFVELKAGVPYRFSVELHDLGARGAHLMIQGETLPKDRLATVAALTPSKAIDGGEQALTLLTKVLQLIQALDLNEREVRYLLTHAAEFDNLDLSTLPTRGADDTAAGARARFAQFLRLAGYSRVKRDVAGGTDDLLSVFEAPTAALAYPLLATLTRRQEETVKAASNAVFAVPAFTDERAVQRLWGALQVIERFGVPVGSLVSWTRVVSPRATQTQRFAIARDLKHVIKARFDPETWHRVVQPISDKLRARQRDALVAYVMHQHRFLSREQLYEYFLIDPGMEPVVQTSRIRLAIGSVQLFIQRSLLNLEEKVHPAAINAKYWEWMKRYRVWEANRKIFLFPENWLEPEFRDDKTHLFTELEGVLLQGDVSNDLVEDAFLNYLKKLDELARLDIVGMHLEDKADPAQNTLHVIGRTYGEPHKYFYRRYAHQVWTAWEPVTAEIEGDHLAPVVWRDRLYLFWVTFMTKQVDAGAPGSATQGQKLVNVELKDVVSDVRASGGTKKIEAHLHWSEYLNGEWSTRESGGVTSSMPILTPVTVPLTFDKNWVFVHVDTQHDNEGNELGVEIHLSGAINQAFYLAGRNSLPERISYGALPANPYSPTAPRANRYSSTKSPFTVSYTERKTTENGSPLPSTPKVPRPILQQGESAYTILPCDNAIVGDAEITSLIKPIFYQDNAHTLFVEPSLDERTIEEWEEYTYCTPPLDPGWGLPDWFDKYRVVPEFPRLDPRDPLWNPPFGPETIIPVQPHHDWLVNPGTSLLMDGELIGARGRVDAAILPADKMSTPAARGGEVVRVQTGGGVASGASVVVRSSDALERAGLKQGVSALNVVGGDGFNTPLAQNFELLKESNFGVNGTPGARLVDLGGVS